LRPGTPDGSASEWILRHNQAMRSLSPAQDRELMYCGGGPGRPAVSIGPGWVTGTRRRTPAAMPASMRPG